MKRIYILLIIVLFLTGCSSVVNIAIDKNSVTETVNISESNLSRYNAIKNWNGFPAPLYYDQELDAPMWMPSREKENGVSYYDVVSDDQNHSLKITGNFKLKEHTRSYLVRHCFRFYNVITEGQRTIFSTSKGLTCSYRNFSIVVSTPYVVINNNADGVDKDNNTFTWNINNSNYRDVGLYMEVDFSKKFKEESNNNNNIPAKTTTNSNYIHIIVGVIIALVALSGLYLYSRRQKNSI